MAVNGDSERPRVVVAGGGVAALEAVIALRELAGDAIDIEIVSPKAWFDYRPLSVLEPFGLGRRWRLPMKRFANDQDASYRSDAVAAVDTMHRVVRTWSEATIPYDLLLLAPGARARTSVRGAVTYRGSVDTQRIERVLDELEHGEARSVAFTLPDDVAWSLPLYELALMTATRAAALAPRDIRIVVVTPERSPLQLFGERASRFVSEQLDKRGIELVTEHAARDFERGHLHLLGGHEILVDRVVALPRLEGPGIEGIPVDGRGFITADGFGRVYDHEEVFAAGDATTYPVKQGGIAAQQADAAAESMAAKLGFPIVPRPFAGVIRGLLLTGGEPAYLRARPDDPVGEVRPSPHTLWWPPTKIAGRHLPAYLSMEAKAPSPTVDGAQPPAGIPIEVDLERALAGRR